MSHGRSVRRRIPPLVAGAIGLLLAGQSSVSVAQQQSGGPASATRFSERDEIRPATVDRLTLAFSFRTGSPRGHAGAPLAKDGLVFVLTPFPHTLAALDLADGRVKWTYRPVPDRMTEGFAAADAVIDGPVLDGERLLLNTVDGHTIALDPGTGRVLWDVAVARLAGGETLRASPLAAGGRVFVGNAGDRFGARGWVAALEAGTGRELWRRFSTGPDAQVGIGPGFRPPYPDDAAPERGVGTWPPSGWRQGGGSVSGPLLFDSAANVLIHGTGHPAPLNPEQRSGSNRWTSGLFARDPETGSARWFTPINPHDLFGLGATAPNLLIDREWRGLPRKLLIHPNSNGTLYVLDRETGRILSAEPFAPVSATGGVDLTTGALRRDPAKATRLQVVARDVCPGAPGALGGAAAFSPATGLVYLPVSRLCMDIEARDASFIPGTPFAGANIRLKPPRNGPRGALVAWDIDAARPAWSLPEQFPLAGGVLATSGGLVVYGTLDGDLKAVDARDGRHLWQFKASSGIIGDPTTFRGPDGRQYLAVLAGLGGPLGRAVRTETDTRDATAADGAANALRDLPRPSDESGTLYVFRLP